MIYVVLFLLLWISPVQAASVSLIWDSTPRATGYKVYRAEKPCNQITTPQVDFRVVASSVLQPSYVDATISDRTRHVCYVVTAYNNAGESPFSNSVGKTFNLAPSSPTKPTFK